MGKENDKKEKRLLPGDFQRKIKYESLDDNPKEIEQSRGRLFEFPEDLKGFQFEDRDFLVFYFDNKEDYTTVLKQFGIAKRGLSHPELDTDKLVKLVKWYKAARERGEKIEEEE